MDLYKLTKIRSLSILGSILLKKGREKRRAGEIIQR